MRPMQLRYKFGPKIGPAHLTRPLVVGELPDLDVAAEYGEITAGPGGTVAVVVLFTVPAYQPGVSHNQLVSVHAIVIPAGAVEPTDPAAALASAFVQASADATDHADGGDLVLSLEGLPVGQITTLTVLAFADAPPPPAPPLDPTDPTSSAPSDPSAPIPTGPPLTLPLVAVPVPDPSAPSSTSSAPVVASPLVGVPIAAPVPDPSVSSTPAAPVLTPPVVLPTLPVAAKPAADPFA